MPGPLDSTKVTGGATANAIGAGPSVSPRQRWLWGAQVRDRGQHPCFGCAKPHPHPRTLQELPLRQSLDAGDGPRGCGG